MLQSDGVPGTLNCSSQHHACFGFHTVQSASPFASPQSLYLCFVFCSTSNCVEQQLAKQACSTEWRSQPLSCNNNSIERRSFATGKQQAVPVTESQVAVGPTATARRQKQQVVPYYSISNQVSRLKQIMLQRRLTLESFVAAMKPF
jgi:hypothetical protein